MSHDKIKEAAVVAYPHEVWQERPLAFVVVKEGEKVTKEELHDFLSKKFANGGYPMIISLSMKYRVRLLENF